MSGPRAALQRAIADACLGLEAGEAIAADLRGWLRAHDVADEDVEAILAAPPRLGIYRSLVRNGLSSVVLRMLPRTRARANSASRRTIAGREVGRFDADVAAFVGEVGPRTHYLRDIPAELVAWVTPRWRADPAVPAYLPDLAAHELAQFAVAASAPAARPPSADPPPVAIDRALTFSASTRLLAYGWAVHELSGDEADTAVPERRDVHLLAYRDAAHVVRWLELTPLAAGVLDRLLEGEALGAAVQHACTVMATAPATVLGDVARVLADLGRRGVLLGARDD